MPLTIEERQRVEQERPAEKSPLGFPLRMVEGKATLGSVTDQIGGIPVTHPHPLFWFGAFGLAFMAFAVFVIAVSYLLYRGVGIWGINVPVAWGFAITNFVWWIGIGHAGTFISAILLLLNQKWRTSINRFTEAMTLFAVICAGMFPLLHLGRPWLFYWLLPYPDMMSIWPQFRSALVWDVFAVGTYFTVSLLFWYLGLLPDLATVRDKCTGLRQKIYGFFALGWRGSAIHWERHQTAYLILAGLATPLVLSVHSVVSFDFSIALLPGWHSTIFPPYFVAGAIYSGFAMVLNLVIPIRKIYGLQNLITERHLNAMGCVLLATCWMVAYGYIMEAFMAWYSGEVFERYMMFNRAFGPWYGWAFWLLIGINVIIPQAAWSRRVRTTPLLLFLVALSANAGMWLERFVIVVGSLQRDFVPSSWGVFHPTAWDWMTLAGSIGLFLVLLFSFIRYVPMISISEVRELVAKKEEARV
jgi:molybdopterin-containing oxidoreductase family membrane subunit